MGQSPELAARKVLIQEKNALNMRSSRIRMQKSLFFQSCAGVVRVTLKKITLCYTEQSSKFHGVCVPHGHQLARNTL